MHQYIYLLREREFISLNQNVYKIGKTKQENLQRFHQYPRGSELLLQHSCDNCDALEVQLIREFKIKYIHRREFGNEYFEGDCKEMIKDIDKKLANFQECNIPIDILVFNYLASIGVNNIMKIDKEMKNIFPDYGDDEAFGGHKKLIHVGIQGNIINIKYIFCGIEYRNIDEYGIDDCGIENYGIDGCDTENCNILNIYHYHIFSCTYGADDKNLDFCKNKLIYYDNIIKHNVIEDNKIYDLNDNNFVKSLDKYKYYVTVHHSDKFELINQKFSVHSKDKHTLLNFCFDYEAILNDSIYCTVFDYKIRNLISCKIDFHIQDNSDWFIESIPMVTINGYVFDSDYLEKYTPYCINLYENDEYELLNREYQIITKEDVKYEDRHFQQITVSPNSRYVWFIENHEEMKEWYKTLLANINEITKNKICRNENQHTNNILTNCI